MHKQYFDNKRFTTICKITADTNNCRNRKWNNSYRIKRNKMKQFPAPEQPVIWLLCGETKDEEVVIQIGRSKSLKSMFKELNRNRYQIISRTGKYKNAGDSLYNSTYSALTFYELNINSYLENEKEAADLLPETAPQNRNLNFSYLKIRASYAEGKLAYETNANKQMWRPSPTGIDGDIFEYFKSDCGSASSAGGSMGSDS